MLQTVIASPWYLSTPVIYRFLEREYVDKFFETGELLLSTFENFSKHDDEKRRDERDGKGIFIGRAPSSTIYIPASHNFNSFVFCSVGFSPTVKTFDKFKKDAAIQVFNTTDFAAAVSKHIPGFKEGMEGYCYYTNAGIEAKITEEYVEKIKALKGKPVKYEDIKDTHTKNIITNSLFFTKRIEYIEEHEYRMLWMTNSKIKEAIKIFVPEAIDLCLPLYKEDFNKKDEPVGPPDFKIELS